MRKKLLLVLMSFWVLQIGFLPMADAVNQSDTYSPPPEFSENCIRETMRPYLEAVSLISYPYRFCQLDPTDKIEQDGLPYYRVMNYSNIKEIEEKAMPYITEECIACNYPGFIFSEKGNKLYMFESPSQLFFFTISDLMSWDVNDLPGTLKKGPDEGKWLVWDLNSVVYAGMINDHEVVVTADRHNQDGVFQYGAEIHFVKTNAGYKISDIVEKSVLDGGPCAKSREFKTNYLPV